MFGVGFADTRVKKDNFQPVEFEVAGVMYHSAENYFQCQKSVGVSQAEFEATRRSGCGADVWSAGTRVQLRPDWEEVKVRIMYEGNRAKFEQVRENALFVFFCFFQKKHRSIRSSPPNWWRLKAALFSMAPRRFGATGTPA